MTIEELHQIIEDYISVFFQILIENEIRMIENLYKVISEFDTIHSGNLLTINTLNHFTEFSDILYSNDHSILQTSNDLILDWTNIYLQNIPDFATLFDEDLFNWYEKEQKDIEQNEKDSHNFNILRLFPIGETMHSKLLKLLLDPKGEHGQGNLFLLLFLESIGIKEPSQGIWKVTTEESNIDLLIKRDDPPSIIIIENKSNWARDQPNQLYRYWYSTIYKVTNNFDPYYYKLNINNFIIIYLCPYGKMYERQSIAKPEGFMKKLPEIIPMDIKILTFKENIDYWIKKCIENIPPLNHRMREYLKQYQEICNNI